MYDEKLVETNTNKTKKEKVSKEKKESVGLKFDYRSAFKKFGILVIIVFAFIFITTKIGQGSANKVFEENLDSMKTGAYKYFKDNERPTENDESYTVTLQDLINDDYIEPLKDKKGKSCNPIDSNVSLVKKTDTKYELTASLTCNRMQQEKDYELTYASTSNVSSNSTKAVYYKLEKGVSIDNYQYSCPEGYVLNGKSCYSQASTLTAPAVAQYKTTSRKVIKASYKKDTDIYEYVDSVSMVDAGHYTCKDKNATLIGDQCVITKDATLKENVSYTCEEGILQGKKCKITTKALDAKEEYYCSSGKLLGSQCRITKSYTLKNICPDDYPNKTGNRCYYTKDATRQWSKKEMKTYTKEMTSTSTKKYEFIRSYRGSNGTMKYEYYYSYLTNTYQCDDKNAELKGSKCYYYTDVKQEKICSSGYYLNSEEKECVKYVDAKKKTTSPTCPTGYTKSGSGSNISCYKYVDAKKNSVNVPKCSSGYEVSGNSCVKSSKATWIESKITYVCPTGYESKGSGKNLQCYKKTIMEGYYYCKTSGTYLDGDQCVREAKTEFVGYKCPSGYDYNGTQCVKVLAGDKVSATKTNDPGLTTTYKWSDKKSESGWIWTGETKEL